MADIHVLSLLTSGSFGSGDDDAANEASE